MYISLAPAHIALTSGAFSGQFMGQISDSFSCRLESVSLMVFLVQYDVSWFTPGLTTLVEGLL